MSAIKERRFGRAVRLPSTLQLKHQILREGFHEAQRAAVLDFDPAKSKDAAPEKVKP